MSSVSIIVPIFNGSGFLNGLTTLTKELAESNCNYELILVDDGSSQEEVRYIEEWQTHIRSDASVEVILLEENKGPGHARNSGIRKSSKEYITFLDADDYLDVASLQILIESLQELSFPEVVETSFQIDKRLYKHGISHERSLYSDTHHKIDRTIEEFLEFRREHSVLGCLFKADLLKDLLIAYGGKLFPDGYHEDVGMWWRCLSRLKLQRGNIVFSNICYYTKISTPGSIVNSISREHLEDYFRNWAEIGKDVMQSNNIVDRSDSYLVGLVALVATRAREIIRHESDRIRQEDLMKHLISIIPDADRLSEGIRVMASRNQIRTQYQMISQVIVDYLLTTFGSAVADLVDEIAQLAKMRWSCQYIQESIFFRPDEIRTCCKRFFLDGAMKGDIRLEINDTADITSHSIMKAKRELLIGINNGSNDCCTGCPFLEFRDWQDLSCVKPKYISIENHSICNLRCSYCSEEYWGGKRPKYSLLHALGESIEQKSLDSVQMVVWGGGEPTLDPSFEETFRILEASCINATQRVITNSTVFSKALADALKRKKAQIITSIDAGTTDTFLKVRGGRQMNAILKNLEKYAAANYRRVTIKYILDKDNCEQSELQSFANMMARHRLLNVNFQISSNFKDEVMSASSLQAGVSLFFALREAGSRFLYFDDLFISRLPNVSTIEEVLRHAKARNPKLVKLIKDSKEATAIWGVGQQTELIKRHTWIGSRMNVSRYIDDTTRETDQIAFQKSFQNLNNMNLSEACEEVFISAVQGYALIREKLAFMGLEHKICASLIL